MSARLRLRRADGEIYLDRWGWELQRGRTSPGHRTPDSLFGIFLHRMDAGDPGIDLHDHPWWFVSLILAGGYNEQRCPIRDASRRARVIQKPEVGLGPDEVRRRWSIRTMRLDEAHTITALHKRRSWSLVIHGPKRRPWGFYLPEGWVHWEIYDQTVRAERRDMWAEISNVDDPRAKVKNR